MQQLINEITNFYHDSAWVIHIFAIVFITLIANYIWRRYYKFVMVRLAKTKNLWDDALWVALHKPLGLLLWVIGISFAAEITKEAADLDYLQVISEVRKFAFIGIVAWFFLRFVSNVEKNFLALETDQPEQKVDETTLHALAKLMRASIIITAALIVMQNLGYSISGLLAFGGIGGLAVGFAAKDLLSNFFGGMMIYLDRPFKVGDWIKSPDRDIEGTVEYIGWRLTRIRTFDKRPIYVPNSIFTSIVVENPSRMLNRRIYETIGVRYDDASKLDKIVADVEQMLKAHKDIDQDVTLMVNLNKFAASSLDFFVYCFTKTTNWAEFHQIKQDVLFKIVEIIEGHQAEIAFPTSTIHLQQAGEPQSKAE
jgi:MscS family membrane protein